jgi:hypothetical protein
MDTKALEDVIQFAIRHGNHDIPLQYVHEAAAELEQLKASCDGWKNTAETSYKRVMELSAERDEMREALEEAYWTGHTEGQLWGRKAISRGEIIHGREIIEGMRAKYPGGKK